jgi:cadmium resistance protein CadD (predicted permease)
VSVSYLRKLVDLALAILAPACLTSIRLARHGAARRRPCCATLRFLRAVRDLEGGGIVDHLVRTIITAGAVYSTNVDDLVILTVLFLSARAGGRPRPWQIVAGMYAGTGALVLAAIVITLGLLAVPDEWVGLLGLAPLLLGLRGLVRSIRAKPGDELTAVVAAGAVSVATVIAANGGDNLAVYPVLFRTLGLADSIVTALVFAVLVGVWCAAAAWLSSHKRLIAMVERFGHWAVPCIFILLGVAIMLESGITGLSFDVL